jgi:hypothetical protein
VYIGNDSQTGDLKDSGIAGSEIERVLSGFFALLDDAVPMLIQ